MPKEMTGAERRKANKIAFLMEDLQISYEEAEEKYKESFRLLGSRGGKNSTGKTGFAITADKDKAKHLELSAKGGKSKKK